MKKNGSCHKCGAPLKKGNIKVIRRPGKRPRRICRKCPFVPEPKNLTDIAPHVTITSPPIVCQDCPDKVKCSNQVQGRGECLRFPSWKNPPISLQGTAGGVLQRPQDTTGGPIVVEGVFEAAEAPRYRYFMTQEQAARVRAAVDKSVIMPGMGVGFEVIPVLEDDVDANPDVYDGLVEVIVNWNEPQ